jgi:hypothetical protein
MYKVGAKVRWKKTSFDATIQNATGVILHVLPSDVDVEEFTMYDVEFDFGIYTLYAIQLLPEQH